MGRVDAIAQGSSGALTSSSRATAVALLVCRLLRKYRKNQGMKDVLTRTVIAAVLVSMALAASAAAVNILQVPDPSIFVLLAASLLLSCCCGVEPLNEFDSSEASFSQSV